MKIHNDESSVLPVPDPKDLECNSLLDRSAAIENHYTYQGETWTSLLRLLSEREVLKPGGSVLGFLTYTVPVLPAEQIDLAPLSLTLTLPDAERLIDVPWGIEPDQRITEPHVPIGDESRGTGIQIYQSRSNCSVDSMETLLRHESVN